MQWFCCSSQTISTLIQKGVIKPNASGMFDLKTCTRSYIESLRHIASGRQETDAKEASLLANVALKKEQTTLCSIRVSKEQKELIPADQVLQQFKVFFRSFRTTLLKLPSEIRISLRLSIDREEMIEDLVWSKMAKLESFGIGEESARPAKDGLAKPNGKHMTSVEDRPHDP
jgi:phage terminase Nu1 subunit (DNA packaging protein)